LIVHARDASAKAFYERLGCDPSPLEPMTLMITLADLRASVSVRFRPLARPRASAAAACASFAIRQIGDQTQAKVCPLSCGTLFRRTSVWTKSGSGRC